jgi:hypothetical protein
MIIGKKVKPSIATVFTFLPIIITQQDASHPLKDNNMMYYLFGAGSWRSQPGFGSGQRQGGVPLLDNVQTGFPPYPAFSVPPLLNTSP